MAGRMLFVHAHPDDETINNGATMARYAAAGVHVTLVTCTRGEEGEIIPVDLAHLGSDRDDTLGDHRVGELADAMAALGVHDHRFLDRCGADGGRPRRYRDSGMAWRPDGTAGPAPDPRPGAFALTDVEEPAGRLADVIREVRPQVLVTYDPGGGYGHPDHVQTHRVATRAVELAASAGPDGAAGWDVPKVYWTVPALTSDAAIDGSDFVDAVIDGSDFVDAKRAAMRAHATQISVGESSFALSNGFPQPLAGAEYYRRVKGSPAGDRDADGRETDLLAGT